MMNISPNNIVVLMGPTASGKSALSLRVAEKLPAVIINADAMQIYMDLPIITACPSEVEMAQAPHRLYRLLDGVSHCDVAMWMELAEQAIREAWADDKLPILVGGTGMYIAALKNGLAHIPDIDAALRASLRAKMQVQGAEVFHAYLHAIDPIMAERLEVGDSQRMLRAAEVVEQTGRSLAEWHKDETISPLPEATFHMHAVTMPRETLYARINARYEGMIAQGALREAECFAARNPPPDAPLCKAIGYPELVQFSNGDITQEDAIASAQQQSRRYAKRQLTWLRNQFDDLSWHGLDEQSVDEIVEEIVESIKTSHP